jgi:Periplasmic protein involved in polysaccharide export
MRTCSYLFFLLVGLIFFASCTSTKKTYQQSVYFRDISDSLERLAPIAFEQRFQPGDILYIGVVTQNEKMAAILNQPVQMNTSSTSGGPIGYLVDNDSSIYFPLLGKLVVSGHTKITFTTELTERLKYYVDSPMVTVRLMNYRVTVLGEVNKPGTITIPNERVSILDAIGLAGDLTIYGIRDSVRVIRQNEGKIESGTINLNSGSFFDSPYFYLKQNDVVYVKMQRRKLASTDQTSLRNASIIMGILSTVAAVTATVINITR